jgi:hypothetical protein
VFVFLSLCPVRVLPSLSRSLVKQCLSLSWSSVYAKPDWPTCTLGEEKKKKGKQKRRGGATETGTNKLAIAIPFSRHVSSISGTICIGARRDKAWGQKRAFFGRKKSRKIDSIERAKNLTEGAHKTSLLIPPTFKFLRARNFRPLFLYIHGAHLPDQNRPSLKVL